MTRNKTMVKYTFTEKRKTIIQTPEKINLFQNGNQAVENMVISLTFQTIVVRYKSGSFLIFYLKHFVGGSPNVCR